MAVKHTATLQHVYCPNTLNLQAAMPTSQVQSRPVRTGLLEARNMSGQARGPRGGWP